MGRVALHGWTLWLMLGLSLPGGGCVDFLGAPPSEAVESEEELPVDYAGKVYRIGSLSGSLAGEAEAAIDFTAHTTGQADGPLVLSGHGLEQLGESERADVAATYAANQPVLLLDATGEQINALRQILGLDAFSMPEGVARMEIYALDHEQDGEVWQWVQYPPEPDSANPDDAEDQELRVRYLLDWLDDNQNRQTPAEEAVAAVKASTNELTQLASAFIDQRNFVESGNNYQISHFIYTFHAVTSGEDWFYIQQQGMFNGRGGYEGRWSDWSTPGDVVSGYMDSIDIDTSINGYAGQVANVGLIQSSPETANNQTEISSGTKYDVGGEISLDKKGASGSLSGGVTVDYSTTFNVLDCTTFNKCGSEGNNAHWTYVFKRCTDSVPLHYILYVKLSDPPALSISTFQPVNQWTWRMAREVRATRPSMHVKLQVNRVRTTGFAEFLWVSKANHREMPGKVFECDIRLPAPPAGQ